MDFAIIGLGKIGIMHTAMVRNVPGARLAALVDRAPKLGRHVQSMMGTPVPFFTSIEEAVDKVPLQGALVCTPQFAHRSVAEECLGFGLDVFVEKPLAHTLEDAEALVAARAKHPDAVTAVGYMKSHQGHYQEIGRLLQEGALGELQGFEATCYLSQVFAPKKGWIYTRNLSGGGMVVNSTCHLLHALHRWFGPVRALTAECKSVYSADVEDEATVDLEFDLVRGQLHTSWSKPGYSVETSRVRIEGDAGVLESDEGGFRLELRRPAAGYKAGVHDLPRAEFEKAAFNLSPQYGGEGYYREDEDFVQACQERRAASVSWEEGLAVQRVIDAVYRSQGQCIDLTRETQA
jgi:predicted dehydrogenase